MPNGETLICSECGRKAVRTNKNQVTCGRSAYHNARTARLAREKNQARKRGRYIKGCPAKPAAPKPKCHTPGCENTTTNYWCRDCNKARARGNHAAL